MKFSKKLIERLTLNDYKVLIDSVEHEGLKITNITIYGLGIWGTMFTQEKDGSLYESPIAVDFEKFFDKAWKCPVILPLPKDDNEYFFLCEKMQELSNNNFDYSKGLIMEYPKYIYE